MSQPAKLVTELKEGDYEITSITLPSSQPVGVDSNAPPSQFVRGNAPVWVWHIKPVPGFNAYRLSLVNAFPYTGVEGSKVVATQNQAEDRVWYIYQHDGHYVIAAAPFWPTPAWTLVDGQILIQLYEIEPGKNQLFDLKYLPPQ